MKSLAFIRILYLVAAVYEGMLGFMFILAAPRAFAVAGIAPPNDWGYVHFSAGLLVVFGWMFLTIALRPVESRNLVIYGVLLKACYILTVGWHEFHGGVPMLWKYLALSDLLFLGSFVWSIGQLKPAPEPGS